MKNEETRLTKAELGLAPNDAKAEEVEAISSSELTAETDEQHLTIWQSVKRNSSAIAYCCGMTLGPVVFGFDIIVVNLVTAMPAFQ